MCSSKKELIDRIVSDYQELAYVENKLHTNVKKLKELGVTEEELAETEALQDIMDEYA